jgi:hypothetical protein
MFLSTHSQTWGRDWQSWQMHSNDSGHTWSKPESMPGRLAKFTFIRGHIVTRDGRILIPFQHYLGPPEGTPEPPLEEKPWHKTLAHYVGNPRNGVLISRDGGKTFSEHGNIRITDRIIHGANYTRCRIIHGAELYTVPNYTRCRIIHGAELYTVPPTNGNKDRAEISTSV